MPIIGMILGIFSLCLRRPFIGRQVTHNDVAGILPGIVAAIWTAWPFFVFGKQDQLDLMHPAPRNYEGTVQDNFERLHQMLTEATYFFGDRWQIISANTQTNRLIANLTYRQEEAQLGAGMSTRREFVRRFIRLDATFKDAGDGRTIVRFDFEQRAEGFSAHICDPIILNVIDVFEARAGAGTTEAAGSYPRLLPPPPWWLLAVTSVALLGFTWDVIKNTCGMR